MLRRATSPYGRGERAFVASSVRVRPINLFRTFPRKRESEVTNTECAALGPRFRGDERSYIRCARNVLCSPLPYGRGRRAKRRRVRGYCQSTGPISLPNGERECSLHFWKSARSREFAHSIRPRPGVGLAEHGKNAALHFGDAVALDLEMGFVSAAVVGVVDST